MSAELGFVHPVTREEMHWTMPLPDDLQELVSWLRASSPRPERS